MKVKATGSLLLTLRTLACALNATDVDTIGRAGLGALFKWLFPPLFLRARVREPVLCWREAFMLLLVSHTITIVLFGAGDPFLVEWQNSLFED